jgi:hypothetical protein
LSILCHCPCYVIQRKWRERITSLHSQSSVKLLDEGPQVSNHPLSLPFINVIEYGSGILAFALKGARSVD